MEDKIKQKKKTDPKKLFLATLTMSRNKDSEKLLFLLDCISTEFGVNKSFLLCELLKNGLENSIYKSKLEEYNKVFENIR